jgi:hypothetical protein
MYNNILDRVKLVPKNTAYEVTSVAINVPNFLLKYSL